MTIQFNGWTVTAKTEAELIKAIDRLNKMVKGGVR